MRRWREHERSSSPARSSTPSPHHRRHRPFRSMPNRSTPEASRKRRNLDRRINSPTRSRTAGSSYESDCPGGLVSEIRLAVRRLMHRRSVMMISVVTLATAIGAAAATWSLLSAVLLNPLPVRDPERLAMIGRTYQSGGISRIGGEVYPYYSHVSASGVFESIAGVWLTPLAFRVNDQQAPDTIPVQFVSRSF